MKMEQKKLNERNIFLQKYLSIQNNFRLNFPSNISKKESQNLIYLLTRDLLVEKFLSFLSPSKIPLEHFRYKLDESKINTIKIIKHKITTQLINCFDYSVDENKEENDSKKITPAIFSLIYEESKDIITKQEKGIFYTQQIEVEFMCKEGIANYLIQNSSIAVEDIISLIWNNDKEFSNTLSHENIKDILDLLENMKILDPSCGSGQFLIGMINILKCIKRKLEIILLINNTDYSLIHKLLSKNIFGFDIDTESLWICKTRLFFILVSTNIQTNNSKFFVNLANKDILIESTDGAFSKDIKEYDIIIGNPPFVRQELLMKPIENKKNLNYKKVVISNITKIFENTWEINHYLKSDFYIYFFYRGLSLLSDKGILCYITSNSWLDSRFGFYFRNFLVNNFQLLKIYSNLTDRAFQAAINTTITIVTTLTKENPLKNSFVLFITLRKKYQEILNYTNLLNFHFTKEITFFEDFRIIAIKQENLIKEAKISGKFSGERWNAQYIRAPDIFEKIMYKISDKIRALHTIGKVRYPIKTGINDFFIIDKKNIERFNIEPEFLVPILKSPKRIQKLEIHSNKLEYKLFVCNYTKKQLLELNKNGALEYIKWGEKQQTEIKQQSSNSISWPKVPSVAHHKPDWYSLSLIKTVKIFCNRFFDRRFFFCYSKMKIVEDQTFYGLLLNREYTKDWELIIAILNSSISYFFLEIFGRTSLGKGALQYTIFDMSSHQIIDIDQIPEKIREELLLKFEPIKKRQIFSIFDEINMPDRIEFDKVLFEWLGISSDDAREIYTSIINLANQRIKKSELVKKQILS
ncbi:MAG: hypothetical protein EAX90_12835 [Candidatus Heimdallarchaeota archaeon]|nr:hypothetical protein [Candidatus Heimdallarchaeota archaeon]